MKERKKEMEQFLKTGVHASQERAKVQSAAALPTLPERDPHRPHAFMEFKVGTKTLDRILIEVFEDRVPVAAQAFLNRCREGSVDGYQGTPVHKLVENLGVFGGLSKGSSHASSQMRGNQYMQHVEQGTVSISNTTSEYVVALSRALTLNATHQVIGRVHKGHDTLSVLNAATCDGDQPYPKITLAVCGLTNAQGDFEALAGAAGQSLPQKKVTPEEQAQQLQAEADKARNASRDALQDALTHKRKAEPQQLQSAAPKRVFLDDGLGDDLSDSDESTHEDA
ncbi:hypothetical protein WJX73_003790 [Symbiochloris irregularis]|uniref:PPIase cyclophilin-type domain-containing protein n=1 Tax=Symbiochloris irregularis TaxID=706552 RepID=A0AAW1NNW2_9CHLO